MARAAFGSSSCSPLLSCCDAGGTLQLLPAAVLLLPPAVDLLLPCSPAAADDNELLTLEIIHQFVEVRTQHNASSLTGADGICPLGHLIQPSHACTQVAACLHVRACIAHPALLISCPAIHHCAGTLSCPLYPVSPCPSQILDKYFGNVCELDLIFNFHKVRRSGMERSNCASHACVAIRFSLGCAAGGPVCIDVQ